MKKIFNEKVKKVCAYYGISKKELFSPGQETLRSDGRYLLYFLCARAGMRNAHIKQLMNQNGFKMNRSSVTRGVQRWQDKVSYDEDLLNDVLSMEA